MKDTFKYELGDILEHRSQTDYGEKFLVVGRYALELIGDDKPGIWYRMRSQHSHMIDMLEAELKPAETLSHSIENMINARCEKLNQVEQ